MTKECDFMDKARKEQFVSGLKGGSLAEINAASFSLLACIVLATCVRSFVPYIRKSKPDSPLVLLVEFALLILPTLVVCTVGSNRIPWINAMITASIGVVLLLPTSKGEQCAQETGSGGARRAFISAYRASMMILTCIAILAVDFHIFPRRFAKVETFGTSMMDLGVGSFVFSSGVVASRYYSSKRNSVNRLFQSIRSALPLLILGVARFFATKTINYQEHVSEYGLQWNFFMTLGFLGPIVSCIAPLKRFMGFGGQALIIAAAYQYALWHGLQNYILQAPRTDIISMNKEGICSFVGYLCIFMVGLDIGSLLLCNPNSASPTSDAVKLRSMVFHSAAYWMLLLGWYEYFVRRSVPHEADYKLYVQELSQSGTGNECSRRMANLPYVIWVSAFNVTFLACFYYAELKLTDIAQGRQTNLVFPELLDATNMNGLAVFLVANLLTGLVNNVIPTLDTPDPIAFLICTVYMFVVCLFAWLIWTKYHIRIKL